MAAYKFSLLRPVTIDDTGTFTRASTAYNIGSTGLLELVGIDVPRFHFDPETLEPMGVLLEAAATNIISQSQDFNTTWVKDRVTVQVNVAVAPDGTMTADRVLDDATVAASHGVRMASMGVSPGTYTTSVFCKPDTGDRNLRILVSDGFGTVSDVIFDLATETFTGTNAETFDFKKHPSGWYRVWSTDTTPDAALTVVFGLTDVAGNPVYSGNSASGLFLWGAQLESGAEPTSYIFTSGGPGLRAADTNTKKLLSNVPEPVVSGADPDPNAWSAATAYTAGQRVSRVARHEIYQRLVSGTTATAPESDTTNWVLVSSMNRWRMFDKANETQTSANDQIVVVIKPGQLVDSLAFENLDADSIRVYVRGTVYDQTLQLKTRSVTDWYSYFFEPYTYKKSAVFNGLPMLTTNEIVVVIRKAALVAKVGTLVVGLSRAIGYAEPGASVGIIDYSKKETDQFGTTNVVKRSYSKRMNVAVIIENNDLDSVQELLAEYRATPVMWVGAGNLYSALVVYGYYRSFDIVIAYPTQSRCNLEIEGLT